ncbi:MAG: hypothetical protein QOG75_5288 [Mycobacterium sp.]|nr:hypothetical protein [Mycobacterium sp.]
MRTRSRAARPRFLTGQSLKVPGQQSNRERLNSRAPRARRQSSRAVRQPTHAGHRVSNVLNRPGESGVMDIPGCFYIVSRGCRDGMCCGEGSVELSADVALE